MATSSQSCGDCDLRHITKPSIVWCTKYQEGLCAECQKQHGLSKASSKHMLIPIFENQKLPIDVLKITPFCSKHDEKFQIYCKKHECSCCSKSIMESHKECRDIVNIDDAIHNVKTSNALYEIEETLVEVAENLQKIRRHKQGTRSTLRDKRIEIEKEIKKTRIKINNHLDKLQENLMKQLYEVEEQEYSKICQLLSSLEIKEKEVAEYQRNITNIKQHATDLQMFLSMKQIEKDAYSKDKFLHLLVESESQLFLSYQINSSIQNIMSDIKSFGELHIEAKPDDIDLIRKKAKQAQIIIPSIENMKLTLHKSINTDVGCVSECCMLPDGRMVFINCVYKRVALYSDNGLKDFEVTLPCAMLGVVYISEDNTLAVTSGGSPNKCITIIDLERKQIKKQISLDSFSYGIALNDNRLIYSAGDKGIRMTDLQDESTSDIVRDQMPEFCHIATFEDKVYQANRGKNTVTCYNLQGKLQWTFQNESVLKFPLSIAVDNHGNVYVLGCDPTNVVVISPDGKRHREVLTKSDGIDAFSLLHYSRSKNQLLVADSRTNAHLFSFI